MADALVWLAVLAVMPLGLVVGSHTRVARAPKDYAATRRAVRRRAARSVRVDFSDPGNRLTVTAVVECLVGEVSTAITPDERTRLVEEVVDELMPAR